MFRRRSFLKSSSLIAGGLVLPKLTIKSKDSNQKKIKINHNNMLRCLQNPEFYSNILTLEIESIEEKVLLEFSFSHLLLDSAYWSTPTEKIYSSGKFSLMTSA